MLVQSGRPVGVMRTHEWAPRVLIANSNLVGDWANWEEFRRLEELGLTMYGQMTAGSWIYIGTQGILQGTFETFAAVADKRFGGTLAGTITVTAGLRRHGRRAAARGDDERRRRDLHRVRPVPHPAADRAPLPRRPGRVAGRGGRRWRSRRATSGGRCRSACSATPRRCCPSCSRPARRSTSSPTRPRRTTRCSTCPVGIAFEDWETRAHRGPGRLHQAGPGVDGRARAGDGGVPGRRRRGVRLRQLDPRRGPQGRLRPGLRVPGLRAGVHPAAVLRGQGPVPLGGALRRPGGHRTRPTGRSSSCSPTTTGSASGSSMAGERVHFQGLPARICWLGYGERHLAGLKFNEMVASGELKAPIVIGRDHLDCGSVASPYRETEAMLDGSDAIADWPLLNALVNTASGATWVSIHHGGGVGIGRSIHAGQVCVADGTDAGRAEDRAGAHQRPGHGRDPARRRRLRPRRRGRRGARRPDPDARAAERRLRLMDVTSPSTRCSPRPASRSSVCGGP